MSDLRFAVRMLGKHPFSSLAVVLTLGLMVGGLTMPWAQYRALIRMQQPFPEPERLVSLARTTTDGYDESLLPADLFRELNRHLHTLIDVGALAYGGLFTLRSEDQTRSVQVTEASAAVFRAARLPVHLGRFFRDDEEQTAAGRVVMLGYEFWKRAYQEDPAVLGRLIDLEGQSYQVIGVVSPQFENSQWGGSGSIQLWLPSSFGSIDSEDPARRRRPVSVVARLKEGISAEAAQAEVASVSQELERQRIPSAEERRAHPAGFTGVRIVTRDAEFRSRGVRAPEGLVTMRIFFAGLTLCALLIAGCNVTHLLLARAGGRAREVAIRMSLGASRARLIRQYLMETLVLGSLGGLTGLLIATWLALIVRWHPAFRVQVGFDPALFLVTLAAGTLLGAGVGLLPALRSTRRDLSQDLKDGGVSTAGRNPHRLRNGLVASQFAAVLALCLTAGLLGRAFLSQWSRPLGFDPQRTALIGLALKKDTHPNPTDLIAHGARAEAALQDLPAVEEVALMVNGSLTQPPVGRSVAIRSPGRDAPTEANAVLRLVSSNFPRLLGMAVRHGRSLSPDRGPVENEAVVDESFVRRHFPDTDPLGHLIQLEEKGPWFTVVGVVADTPRLATRPPEEALAGDVFVSFRHAEGRDRFLQMIVATRVPAETMLPAFQTALRALDARQPEPWAEVINAVLARQRSEVRILMQAIGGLAGGGLLLALLGIYAVVSTSVLERTREMGIRMALGATPGSICRLLIHQGIRLCVLGTVPGLVLALAVTRFLPRPVHAGTEYSLILPLILVLALLSLTALLASWIPARRAAGMSPMAALRSE